MIPYLHNTKEPLPSAYGMRKALSRSESQLMAKTCYDGLNCSGNVSQSLAAFFFFFFYREHLLLEIAFYY